MEIWKQRMPIEDAECAPGELPEVVKVVLEDPDRRPLFLGLMAVVANYLESQEWPP